MWHQTAKNCAWKVFKSQELTRLPHVIQSCGTVQWRLTQHATDNTATRTASSTSGQRASSPTHTASIESSTELPEKNHQNSTGEDDIRKIVLSSGLGSEPAQWKDRLAGHGDAMQQVDVHTLSRDTELVTSI